MADLPEIPKHWKPYATFGDFPTYGGIIYRNGTGYGMLLGREGESRDDIWVWVVDDATDKLALQDYDLAGAAEYVGMDAAEMRGYAQSDDPVVLANVWQAVADHQGYLDLYGDPDWSGEHDEIWNEFADDYNRANRAPRRNNPSTTSAAGLVGKLKF